MNALASGDDGISNAGTNIVINDFNFVAWMEHRRN
jgi:hypothetical protein